MIALVDREKAVGDTGAGRRRVEVVVGVFNPKC